jgi:hypothetical protein
MKINDTNKKSSKERAWTYNPAEVRFLVEPVRHNMRTSQWACLVIIIVSIIALTPRYNLYFSYQQNFLKSLKEKQLETLNNMNSQGYNIVYNIDSIALIQNNNEQQSISILNQDTLSKQYATQQTKNNSMEICTEIFTIDTEIFTIVMLITTFIATIAIACFQHKSTIRRDKISQTQSQEQHNDLKTILKSQINELEVIRNEIVHIEKIKKAKSLITESAMKFLKKLGDGKNMDDILRFGEYPKELDSEYKSISKNIKEMKSEIESYLNDSNKEKEIDISALDKLDELLLSFPKNAKYTNFEIKMEEIEDIIEEVEKLPIFLK